MRGLDELQQQLRGHPGLLVRSRAHGLEVTTDDHLATTAEVVMLTVDAEGTLSFDAKTKVVALLKVGARFPIFGPFLCLFHGVVAVLVLVTLAKGEDLQVMGTGTLLAYLITLFFGSLLELGRIRRLRGSALAHARERLRRQILRRIVEKEECDGDLA